MRSAYVLCLVPAIASAEAPIPDDAWYPRLTAGVGIGYRTGDLGVLTPTGASVHAALDVKLRPALFAGVHYEWAPNTARDDALVRELAVTTQTAGVAIRSPLMSYGDKPKGFRGDMFVSGGIAREWIRWDGGGLSRDVLALGLGTTMLLPFERTERQLRFHVRMFAGRAPDPAKRPAGCDGPCDTPTATAPYDLSFVMEVSCHVGR